MKRFAIGAAIVLTTAAGMAQDLAESIDVRVVNVDVIVRDRAGKPVTGLTKSDFDLYENGQKREITNLYEVRPRAVASVATPATPLPSPAAEQSTEIRPHNVVMFIDNYSLNPFRRDKVLQSLRKFVDEQLRPQDRVMLAVSTQQVQVVTPFTTDRKTARDGIESVKKIASGEFNRASAVELIKRRIDEYIDAHKANPGKFDWKDYYSMSLSLVDGYVEEEILSSRKALASLGQVTAALGGLEGKNVVIYAGAHLPERPGAELYQWLYNAFSPYMPGLSLSMESIGGKTGSMQHYTIEEAAKKAAANDVVLYVIDAADSRDSGSAENSTAIDAGEQFSNFTNTAMAYQTLARISGGLALTHSDNFDAAFQTLASDLNSYYSLGFRPADGTSNAPRKIVVKMKNPAYQFRARSSYIPKAAEAQDDMNARVIANLYTTDPHNVWEISVKPGTPEKQGSEYRVSIEVTMAPTITLEPQDENLVGNFAVFVVVGNGENTSKVVRNVHAVKVPVDAEDDFREKKITYKATIAMTSGDNVISVAVVDQANKSAGFARAKVAVP